MLLVSFGRSILTLLNVKLHYIILHKLLPVAILHLLHMYLLLFLMKAVAQLTNKRCASRAPKVRPFQGVRGHAPPENLEQKGVNSCIIKRICSVKKRSKIQFFTKPHSKSNKSLQADVSVLVTLYFITLPSHLYPTEPSVTIGKPPKVPPSDVGTRHRNFQLINILSDVRI